MPFIKFLPIFTKSTTPCIKAFTIDLIICGIFDINIGIFLIIPSIKAIIILKEALHNWGLSFIKVLFILIIISGNLAINSGSAFIIPSINATNNCIPHSIIKSILSNNISTISNITFTIVGINSGSASVIPCIKVTNIVIPACNIAGKLFVINWTIVNIICAINGAIFGNKFTIEVIKLFNIFCKPSINSGKCSVNISNNLGINSPIPSNAVIILGNKLSNEYPTASTKSPTNLSKSALSSAIPFNKLLQADLIILVEPCIVVLASSAVFPNTPYWSATFSSISNISLLDNSLISSTI